MAEARRLIESHRIFSENLAGAVPLRLAEKMGKQGPYTLVRLVNAHSLAEKQGGGRPEHWEMVFWWTRKPLAGARFVVAASLLPEDTSPKTLAKALGLLEDRVAHRVNPRPELLGENAELLHKASLLDPFAGFGSIPLEAARLGLRRVVAVELLPTAYVFLKAVLEYPARYAHLRETLSQEELRELEGILDTRSLEKTGLAKPVSGGVELPALIADLARAAKEIVDRLREDPDIRELYDPDTAVYIGTWEAKCPGTNTYTPLVANWWLARVKDKANTYKRLAYMKPVVRGDTVDIEVVDLNRLHGTPVKATVKENTITVNGEKYEVPEPNITARSETAVCLQTGAPLGYIDPETRKHYATRQQAPREARGRLLWYPKWALREWNRLLEDYLEGKITLEELQNAPARPRLLVKVKPRNGDIEFQPATPEDQDKLWKALEKLRQHWGDPDIPTERLWPYTMGTAGALSIHTWGFDKFYKLFNPRQLLTLTKLIKQIRATAEKLLQQKQEHGWSKEEHKFTEAIVVYLALWLINFVRYYSTVTQWDATYWGRTKVKQSFAMRGIAMQWNWCEFEPIQGLLTFLEYTIGGVSYLITSFISSNYDRIFIFLNDAVTLGGVNGERFDVVVTDPPYYDDVPYSELSDFYYVWLKRALSRVEGGVLRPWFLPEAFYRRVGGVWRERRTQWEEFARREISVNLGRLGLSQRELDRARRWFEERLGAALRRASQALVDGGLLVTYYNHTSVDAWSSLLRAGWEIAGLRVTAAVPLVTESGTRVTSRGKVKLDTSIVVVWRRGVSRGVCDEAAVLEEALGEARGFVEKIVGGGVVGYDLLFAALGRALAVLTSCSGIVSPRGRLGAREVAELGYRVATRAVAEALAGASGVRVESQAARFYMLVRVLFAEAEDIRLDGSTLGILQVGMGAGRDSLVALRILAKPRRSGEPYPLLYPRATGRGELRRLLAARGLTEDPGRAVVKSSVDVLHLLYYALVAGRLGEALEELRGRAPGLVEEALGVARVLCRLLPRSDPERLLACRVGGGERALTEWLSKG